jgi:CDP-4-dehydro-6-deoxyglucose reductase
MYTIKLKNDIHFTCDNSDTILNAAFKENIVLDHSCKTGRCQSCRAKVLEGTSYASVDELGLTEEEKSLGYILTCVRTATSDLELDIEDLSGYAPEKAKTVPAKIDSISRISNSVIEIQLRVPPNANFNYISGQYVNIIKGDIKRSYSIGNANKAGNLVFFIKNYEGGRFSNYLFNEAKTNDLLRIEGPIGTFFYRNTSKKNIIFLATGTGIAPIKAILEQMSEDPDSVIQKNIYLFFGGRTEEDLFWIPDFRKIKVTFVPVLSRSNPSWTGATGYIQDSVLTNEIDLSDSVVYACGSVNMIQDSKEVFVKNKLDHDLFYSDAFISS